MNVDPNLNMVKYNTYIVHSIRAKMLIKEPKKQLGNILKREG